MANQELFGYEMPKGKVLEEVTKRLLEDKPKEKRILRGRINLDKVYGPDTYTNVGEQIEKDGLLRPTMAETASLVYDSFNSKNKPSNEIKKIMKAGWLWAFTGILYVPNKGAYIQDNPKIVDEYVFMDESDLVKKLQKNDKSVRFVPFGYQIGGMTSKELGKNKFVIGLAGEEGAEKLAEVAGKHKNKPYLWSHESVNGSLTRVSTVYSVRNEANSGLNVSGSGGVVGVEGYSFGVRKKTGGANRAEK